MGGVTNCLESTGHCLKCSNDEEGNFEFLIHTFGMCGSKPGLWCIEKHHQDALKNAVQLTFFRDTTCITP